jgi:hypothetical protein
LVSTERGRSAPPTRLGLKKNWRQFALLVLVNAFVGGMVGLERTVVPLVGSKEFGLVLRTATVSRHLLLVASAEQPEAVKGDGDGGAHVGEHR